LGKPNPGFGRRINYAGILPARQAGKPSKAA